MTEISLGKPRGAAPGSATQHSLQRHAPRRGDPHDRLPDLVVRGRGAGGYPDRARPGRQPPVAALLRLVPHRAEPDGARFRPDAGHVFDVIGQHPLIADLGEAAPTVRDVTAEPDTQV